MHYQDTQKKKKKMWIDTDYPGLGKRGVGVMDIMM